MVLVLILMLSSVIRSEVIVFIGLVEDLLLQVIIMIGLVEELLLQVKFTE
jgi:hypothetical protein